MYSGLETLSCVTTAIPRHVAELMDLDGQKAPNCVILSLPVIPRLLCIYKVIIGSRDRQQIITIEDSMQNGCFLKYFAEWARAKANTGEETVAQGDEDCGNGAEGTYTSYI